jgi:hypothetical protein
MSRTWKPVSVLVVVLLAMLAAGCGSSNEDTNATSNPSPATTNAAETPFTAEQWQEYQAAVAAFQKVNLPALNRVELCAKKINPPPGAMEKCVGDKLTKANDATDKLSTTLQGFTASVGGACLTALHGFLGYVAPYKASLHALQQTISTDNAAAAYNSAASIETARTGGLAKNEAVKKQCAPA